MKQETNDREVIAADEAGAEIERAAEERREQAFDANHEWHGTKLHAWTVGREQLYFRLRAVDAAVPLHVALQNPESFLGDAIKILYLCSHEPREWRDLLTDVRAFVEAINVWAEDHVKRDEQSDVIDLANRILTDADSTKAVLRPSGNVSEGEAKN
jgi:hypothetical protein